jgi:hypothetical protein
MEITKANRAKPKLDNKLLKKRNRREYSAQRYQEKKEWYHKQYLQKKAQKETQEKEKINNLYQANSIRILLSLKDYTNFKIRSSKKSD